MDEHRVGLQPILRYLWAKKGSRPIATARATVRPVYEWLYVAGSVHPQSGRTSFWLLLVTQNQ